MLDLNQLSIESTIFFFFGQVHTTYHISRSIQVQVLEVEAAGTRGVQGQL